MGILVMVMVLEMVISKEGSLKKKKMNPKRTESADSLENYYIRSILKGKVTLSTGQLRMEKADMISL